MATETIYYRVKTGVHTRDPLRSLTDLDQAWLKTVLQSYIDIVELDARIQVKEWFDMQSNSLPRQPLKNNERNSRRSFCLGMLDKLNQAPSRRDLSPKQCTALEKLSLQVAELYAMEIPQIKFVDAVFRKTPSSAINFGKMFKRLAKS